MIKFLKELYSGKLPLSEMLWMYGVLPLLFIFLSENLRIFNQEIGATIAWLVAVFSFIAWSGVKKGTVDPLLILIASILRFILFIVIIFAGPMAMFFGFSGYKG